MSATPSQRGLGTTLSVTVFLNILPVTLLVPVLRDLVMEPFGADERQTAWFLSINMFGAVVVAPFAGALAARIRNRPRAIAIGLLLDGLLLAALTVAPSYGVLMLIRLLEGIANAFAIVLTLGIASESVATKGRRIMGAVGGSLILGVAMGVPIGGILGRYGASVPVLVGAAISIFGAAWVWLRLRESGGERRTTRGLGETLRLAARYPRLLVPYAYAFTDRFTVGFYVTTLNFYLGSRFDFDSRAIGLSLACFLIPFALASWPIGRLLEGRSLVWPLGLASIAYGLGTASLGVLPWWAMNPTLVLLGTLASLMLVPTISLCSALVPRSLGSVAMGGFHTAGSLGFLVGPAVAGELGHRYGPELAFAVGGGSEIVLVLLTLPFLISIERKRHADTKDRSAG